MYHLPDVARVLEQGELCGTLWSPTLSYVWIISPSDKSMRTTLTTLRLSWRFSLSLYLAAGKKCQQAPTPGSVLEPSLTLTPASV